MTIDPRSRLRSHQRVVDRFFRGFNGTCEHFVQWRHSRSRRTLNQCTYGDLRSGPARYKVAVGKSNDDLATPISGSGPSASQAQCGPLCQALALSWVKRCISGQDDDTTTLIANL